METTSKITEVINKQIGVEGFTSQFYLNIASYCDYKGYKNSAKWFYKNATEKIKHREIFVKYLCERKREMVIEEIKIPSNKITSLSNCFEISLKKEQDITKLIEGIYEICLVGKDHITRNFMEWFINEQRNSEHILNTILDTIKTFPKEQVNYLIERMIKDMEMD